MDPFGAMVRSSGLLLIIIFTICMFCVTPGSGIKCYQCGQYTDGVGSITPCINYTERLHLKDCPLSTSHQCIKYVSEGSTVRDCAPAECVERGTKTVVNEYFDSIFGEGWGTKVYCCSEDGCNGASIVHGDIVTSAVVATLAAVMLHMVAN